MSDSQNTSTGVKFEVTIGGGPVETTDVMSVTVDHDLDLPAMCLITLKNPTNKFNAKFKPGDTVVIQGAGTIGIMALQIARISGAGVIIMLGTDVDTQRLEVAQELDRMRALMDALVSRVHVHQHQSPGVFRQDIHTLELSQGIAQRRNIALVLRQARRRGV